jgi:hypothetical protein
LFGELTAPTTPGVYDVTVSSGDGRASAPIVVSASASVARAEHADLLAALAAAHGGTVIDERDAASEVGRRIRPAARAITWHPMRSVWWIVPFALALSGEWYLRRRRGLR